MPLTDELFETLIREADPARTPIDIEPTAADWARLHRMLDEAADPSRVRAKRVRLIGDRVASLRRHARASRPLRIALRSAWAAPALAAVVAIGLAIGPITAVPAYAVTPPALVAQPIAQSADEVLAESITMLQKAPTRAATRDALVVRWALRDDGKADPVIVPEWQEWVWDADGTGHLESRTGAPYSVTKDGTIVPPAGEAPKEGTALPGTGHHSSNLYFAEPPADASGLRSYIEDRVGLSGNADALGIWGVVSSIRDSWALSPAQQAAALQLLRDAGGVSVLGTVTDRLGRSGIALKVTSSKRPQFTATVVLDAGTREIIAADTIYQGGSTMKLNVASGSVIEYKAWLSR
ncbi:MAG: hypothetical protein LBE60_05605 [Microbacterium sp.]|jgi:hypothetical protein|uniref:hypothetical protein n=1 Tax=Microbacterium sp. TaxID=51671 RepID=UPI002828E5B7|nr:hypothetical protein [Microbacterium sp.]MDR2321106.1 hypothetical protein [Microbacterium sp.]